MSGDQHTDPISQEKQEEFEEVLAEFDGDNKIRQLENMLKAANDWATRREEGTIDEMLLDFGQDGGLFFLTQPGLLTSKANIHRAFGKAAQELWIDEDIVRDYDEKVTPEGVGEVLAHQVEEFMGWEFEEQMKRGFIEATTGGSR